MRTCFWLAAATVLAICVPSEASAPRPYVLTHLGELTGITAADINTQGHVVGHSVVAGGVQRGFIWTPVTPNGSLGILDAMSPANAGAAGINDARQVVGQSSGLFTDGIYIWKASSPNGSSGATFNLAPNAGSRYYATSINSYGQAAGYEITGNQSKAMLVTPHAPNSIMSVFISFPADLPGGPEQSAANDLNSMGQVVGWANFPESAAASHAFLWSPDRPNHYFGSMYDLGDLPGGNDASSAHGINSRGQVVGDGSVESGSHAFLWSPTATNGTSGTMIDLGDLAGLGGISSARDINSRGIVVGHSGSTGAERAFAWMPTAPNGTTGTMIDLNTLLDPVSSAGWTLKFAEAINDFGQIVGNGLFDRDGPGRAPPVERAFLLTPIPEPATTSLVVGGVALLLRVRRKSQRRGHGVVV